jgi:hypothetical protein
MAVLGIENPYEVPRKRLLPIDNVRRSTVYDKCKRAVTVRLPKRQSSKATNLRLAILAAHSKEAAYEALDSGWDLRTRGLHDMGKRQFQ